MLAKKNWAIFILASILAVSFVQFSGLCSAKTSGSASEVTIFLRDVAMIDVEKYTVSDTIGPLVDYEVFEGIPYTSGKLTLNSETSIIDVLYNFVGDSLTSCTIELVYGPVKYLQSSPAKLADAADLFLEKYQVYSDDSSIAAIRNTLVSVDATKDMTKIVGDVKLEISNTDLWTSFQWEKTYNGATYPGMGLVFKDGAIYSFGQDTSYYTIGSTVVKITQEQAIEIALNRLESYSYTYQDQKIEKFNIVKDSIDASLEVKSRYKNLELYPLWRVDLPLDDIYPGSVYFIRVNLWADNGEIINIRPLGGGYYDATDGSNSNEVESENNATMLPTIDLIAIAIAISIMITIAIVAFKRRSR